MSSSSNYNAITNLTETIIDFLVVDTAEIDTALIENLDCNVGTIDTLTTSTATISSANIPTLTNTTLTNTTSNTTNLNTNNIQPSPLSSTVSLYTNGTGTLTLGNLSNSNALTINQNTTIGTGKKITTPGILVSGTTASKLLLTDASKNIVSSLYDETTLPVSTPQQTALNLKANLASPTFTGTVTTPALNISGITASKLTKTDASKNIVSSLYDETTLPVSTPTQTALNLKANINAPVFTTSIGLTSGNLTISSGNLICNTFQGTTATNSIQLFTNTTGSPTFPTIELGNSGAGSGSFFIYPNTNMNGNLTMASGKKITTPDILVSNLSASLLTKTDGSKNIVSSLYDETTLPVSTPTQTALNLKANINAPVFTTSIGLTSGNLTISSGNLICNTINATTTSSNGVLFGNITAGLVNIAGLLTGFLNIGASVIDGIISIGSPLVDVSINSGYIDLFLPTFFRQNLSVDTGKNLTLSTTGKIVNNTFQGTTVGSNINLYSLTTGLISVGGASSSITFQDNILTAIGRTLTMTTSGSIINDIYRGISVGNAISLFSTTTTGSITVGGGLTTGSINCGLIGMSGNINLRANTLIGTSAVNKGLTCNFFDSFNDTDLVRISANLKTGNIRLGETQTTGGITIGHQTPATDTGTLTINKNTVLATNKNLTLGNQSKLVGGTNGTANITAVAFTNVVLFTTATLAGFYQVNIYGSSATQTFSVNCFLSADNSGAIQTIASRNMTFQISAPNYTITATVAPTSTITMTYNVIRLV